MRTRRIVDVLAASIWAYAIWLLITWTATAEQLLFGAALALVVGWVLALSGPLVAPWRVLSPRRFMALLRLTVDSVRRIVVANIALTRRIWGPKSELRTGMIIVPTEAQSDGALASVGLITSLIVDNQLVDLDRSSAQLQYHAIEVPPPDAAERYERVNGPTERNVRTIAGER